MDEAFFRAKFDADKANQAKQSWNDYVGWVKKFYDGQRFPPIAGWSSREADLVKKAPAEKAKIEETGRLLAAEWAKDNSVRKVSTDDLRKWGGEFGDAAKDPAALAKALDAVRAEIQRRTGP